MASGEESLVLGLLGDIDTTFAFFDFMTLQDESGCVSRVGGVYTGRERERRGRAGKERKTVQ